MVWCMNYNNREGSRLTILIGVLILLVVGIVGKGSQKRVKMIEDLPELTLSNFNDKWFMHL